MDMNPETQPSMASTSAASALELAIILPTLNERDNLAPLVERIEGALGRSGWEVLIVDDNSADGTSDEARRLSLSDPRVRVIQRIGRRGLSSAAIEGFCATAAPYVAVMDADHQHDPKLLVEMLIAVKSGEADVAVASRFAEGASMAEWNRPDREKLSSVANTLARKLTGVDLSDPMSGFFLLRSATARELVPGLSGIGFKILLDLLATSETPLKVKDFPMNFSARRSGESKLDRAIALDFLAGLYDKSFGRVIPTRFALLGTVGVIASVTRPFCGDCDRVRLTADGQVRNCLFAREESDLRTAMREGASDEELADRWVVAMRGKAAGHGIDDETFLQPTRPMSAIGG